MTTTKRLVFVHNGGYDSVLLVDADGRVLSRWDVTPKVAQDYLREGSKPELWDDQGNDEDLTIADFGEIVGENGNLSNERREFWLRGEA